MTANLLSLDVLGAGTEDVESLASYFHRVRRHNRGKTGTWLGIVSQPQTPRSPGARNIRLLGNVNTYDGAMAKWLHAEGCPAEALNLGIHRAAWVRISTFRDGRAWCPACLDEQPGHEKLLWTFREYRWCSRHQMAIEDRCPRCSWSARFVSSHAHRPGHCDGCGYSLAGSPTRTSSQSEWARFCAEQIGTWVRAYQSETVTKPLFDIESLSIQLSAFNALLVWSWCTNYDIVTYQRSERAAREPINTEGHLRYLSALAKIGVDGVDQYATIASLPVPDRNAYQAAWIRNKRLVARANQMEKQK